MPGRHPAPADRARDTKGRGMICALCDQGIVPGQPFTTHTVHSGSGAAPDTRHHDTCPRSPAAPNGGPGCLECAFAGLAA